ncbi:maltose acetyltransferase domain-containing protein [Ligilactobacillus murinus]|uniref:maltose acetyltransferase domain-containing protein n=1 Tax=Ligilactobacillus murinus TaxID=1622 RepID=UPI00129823C0|nr:maltose acetyltransferase domain-containing protein [Ligilactobacillus murinus]
MLGKQTHRMQCGMMYNDLDPELMRARQKTMALTTAYAQSYSQSPAKREALLAKILGKIGKNVHFEPTFRCEFGKNISIGDNVWIGAAVHINQGGTIGDNTVIGSGSVVTHDISSNVVAYGDPCRVVRKITAADKTGYDPTKI